MEIEDHIISKQTEKPAKVTKYPNAIIIRITYEYEKVKKQDDVNYTMRNEKKDKKALKQSRKVMIR